MSFIHDILFPKTVPERVPERVLERVSRKLLGFRTLERVLKSANRSATSREKGFSGILLDTQSLEDKKVKKVKKSDKK